MHFLQNILQLFGLCLLIKIFNFFPVGDCQLNRMVRINPDVFQIDPSMGPDHSIALGIQLRNSTGNTDGIKAIFRQFFVLSVFLQRCQNNSLVHCYSASARAPAKLVYLEKHRGIRRKDHIIYRYNNHNFLQLS